MLSKNTVYNYKKWHTVNEKHDRTESIKLVAMKENC